MANLGGKRNHSYVYALCVMDKMNDAKLRAFYDENVKLLCIRRQVLLKNTSRLLDDMYSHMHARDVANRKVDERAPTYDVIDVLPDERVGEFDEDVAMENASVKPKSKSENVSRRDVTTKRRESRRKRRREARDVNEAEFCVNKSGVKRQKLASGIRQGHHTSGDDVTDDAKTEAGACATMNTLCELFAAHCSIASSEDCGKHVNDVTNDAIVAKPASKSTSTSCHASKPESHRQPIQFDAASVFGEDFESTLMLDEAFDDIYYDLE